MLLQDHEHLSGVLDELLHVNQSGQSLLGDTRLWQVGELNFVDLVGKVIQNLEALVSWGHELSGLLLLLLQDHLLSHGNLGHLLIEVIFGELLALGT